MKTERKAKISFGKMGTGKGSRINLSIPLLKSLGITEENREVLIIYDDEAKTVTIKQG
jgi:hypothetical protein cdivTM_18839|nr:MAG TPA: Toxin SymE, type I toxin-antitoxin system [Caudoviricetes sp.]